MADRALLAAAAVAAFTFALVYSTHLGAVPVYTYNNLMLNNAVVLAGNGTAYDYPLHHNEWFHITQARYVMGGWGRGFVDPRYREDTPYANYELGFDVFLAVLFKLTGLDPVLSYRFLPAVFAGLGCLTVFMFSRQLGWNAHAALLSMLFFATLRSDINMMGTWFFIPATMAIPLAYLSAAFFLKSLHDGGRNPAYLAVTLLAELAIYAPYALLSAAVFVAYMAAHVVCERRGYWMLGAVPAAVLAGVIGFHLLVGASHGGGLADSAEWIADRVTFRISDEEANREYVYHDPVKTYGAAPSLMAFAGLCVVCLRAGGNGRSMILVPWVLLSVILLFMASAYGVTYLARHVRILYFLMLALVPLSGIGLYAVAERFGRAVGGLKFAHSRLVAKAAVLLIVGAVFLVSFHGYYRGTGVKMIYHPIDGDDYEAVKWLGSTYGQGHVVLAAPWISETVYPISGNHIIVNARDIAPGKDNVFTRFMKGNCTQAKSILDDNGVEYVISKWRLGCTDHLSQVYDGGDYVYEVNKPRSKI